MLEVLFVLGVALTGGLLVLHGFGKTKGNSEKMLEMYQDLLEKSQEEKNEDEDEDEVDRDRPAAPKPF